MLPIDSYERSLLCDIVAINQNFKLNSNYTHYKQLEFFFIILVLSSIFFLKRQLFPKESDWNYFIAELNFEANNIP